MQYGITPLLEAAHDYYQRGFVPIALAGALRRVGVPGKYVKDAVDQIQTAVTWTYAQCWLDRCKHVWNERRKQEREAAARQEQETRNQRTTALRNAIHLNIQLLHMIYEALPAALPPDPPCLSPQLSLL
jgi:hypothetical protein